MKHLKQKLIAATTMMLLCAVMLSSVSYAWFTLSTNPEIKGMKATVSANENLEIVLDNGYADAAAADAASYFEGTAAGSKTGNPYTWGNTIDLGTLFSTEGNKVTLNPVKYVKAHTDTDSKEVPTNFQYPQYGPDGRVDELVSLNGIFKSANTTFVDGATDSGNKKALAGGVKFYNTKANGDGVNYAFSATYWLRTNVDGTVSLGEAAKLADDETNTNTTVNDTNGSGSYFEFKNYSSLTDDYKTAVSTFLTGKQTDNATPKAFTIVFFVGDEKTATPIYATLIAPEDDATGDAANRFKINASLGDFTANTAQKVTMYVYVNGESITNADALLNDSIDGALNIQFQHSAIGTGTDQSGSGAMTGEDKPAPTT